MYAPPPLAGRCADQLRNVIHIDDQHAQLLTPAFALSGTLHGPAPTYENMSTDELEAFLLEMEPDIRAADRDMREIELLEQKGVLSAGKLAGARVFFFFPISILEERPC